MLLQERNYCLYFADDEVDLKHHASSSPVASSAHFSCTSKAKKNSSKNRLRRSTFDLSSVSSLSTSSSDSSSCYLSSPSQKNLRYRGFSSSTSTTHGYSTLSEGDASRALRQLGASKSSLYDLRQGHSGTQGEQDPCVSKASSATTQCTHNMSVSDSQTSEMNSFLQYFLEVIVLGYLVVPFLHLTIRMERYFRSAVGDLHRNAGFALASVYAPSYSIHQEPVNFESKELSFSSEEDVSFSSEAIYSCSSSSSSIDESDEDEDGWGHFADFRDELADEASFIPSCSAAPLRNRALEAVAITSCGLKASNGLNTLETLDEGHEEEDEEEDWSF